MFSFLADQVTLLFVGDISFSGPVKCYVEHKYHTYNHSFNEVAPHIRQADILIGNLESPFVNQDVYRHKYKGKKSVLLDARPEEAQHWGNSTVTPKKCYTVVQIEVKRVSQLSQFDYVQNYPQGNGNRKSSKNLRVRT